MSKKIYLEPRFEEAANRELEPIFVIREYVAGKWQDVGRSLRPDMGRIKLIEKDGDSLTIMHIREADDVRIYEAIKKAGGYYNGKGHWQNVCGPVPTLNDQPVLLSTRMQMVAEPNFKQVGHEVFTKGFHWERLRYVGSDGQYASLFAMVAPDNTMHAYTGRLNGGYYLAEWTKQD